MVSPVKRKRLALSAFFTYPRPTSSLNSRVPSELSCYMTATEQEGRAQRVDTLLRPTEEAFDAKRRWRKAAEEIADEALGFDTKRAWRKALASRGAKSYDGLVVATVEYEDGGLADDGTHIWKPLTKYKLPDRAPELQPEDEDLDLVAAASALGATVADLSRLQPQVGGSRATTPQHSMRTITTPQHNTPSRIGVVGSRQQSPTTTPQHSTPRPRTPASSSVWASPRALRGESQTRRRLPPSKATSALRCLSPSPLSPLARGTATAAAAAAAAATATTTVAAAAHWAPPGQPCAEDAPGHGAAPRAGGEVASPRSVEESWEWDVGTTVTRTAAAAAGYLSAEVQESALHVGGCHCGDVRFEVEAASHLVVWDCDCSNCRMRRNVHFVVPDDKLHIVSEAGAAALAEYRFGSGVARHLFCARCGVSPFYRPRSNPDGWAVTFQVRPMPQCHNATMPQCHNATMPQCHNAVLSQCANAPMPQCANAALPERHHAPMLPCHAVTIELCANVPNPPMPQYP